MEIGSHISRAKCGAALMDGVAPGVIDTEMSSFTKTEAGRRWDSDTYIGAMGVGPHPCQVLVDS
jgi:hypothetical protein